MESDIYQLLIKVGEDGGCKIKNLICLILFTAEPATNPED